MEILMSGSSGLIGSALRQHWQAHTIHRIHHRAQADQRSWGSDLQLQHLPPLDLVVHLAGAGIADKRWSEARKQTLLDSRIATTEQLVREILALDTPPATVLCASAIGFYGDRGDQTLTETAAPDSDSFSGQLVQRWEACVAPLQAAGIRVVSLRFGIVLSAKGGALGKMLPPFKLGAGGRIGDGRHWMSWISMPDLLAAIDHIIAQPQLQGPINMTAPEPLQNSDFARLLAAELKRPCLLPMPAAAVSALFGQMGQELLLGSAKVIPQALLDSGYQFQHPQLAPALSAVLSPP